MTTRLSHFLALLALSVAALLAPAAPGRAQSDLFSPAVFVNDRVITRYEIEQSKRFLGLLRQPGNLDEIAVERLIEDRLRLDAAAALGITTSEEQVAEGMAEFAGRANLTTEEFLQAIGQAGVEPETFRSFVEAGILWRLVIRTRFAPRTQITEAEIDRAIAMGSRQGGVQVLLSEIVLPANTPAAQAQAQRTAERLAGQSLSEGAFAAEARRLSASPSSARGGRLDWLPLGNLPPQVAAQVVGLAPGQVSAPYPVTNAIVLFYLRDLRETGRPEATALALEWAEYAVTGAEEAARVQARIDTCDDLYGVARGQPEERLRRETRATGEVPSDIALELARLDEGESALMARPGGQASLVVLCARTYELPMPGEAAAPEGEDGAEAPQGLADVAGGPSREQVRAQLLNQRLMSYADGYLAELRADATIRYQ